MLNRNGWIVAALLAFAVSGFAAVAGEAEGTVTISGRVTDFKGAAIEGAMVALKDDRFDDVAAAQTGADGRYSLTVPAGHYMALIAVKDYQVKSLEFWAWSVPAVRDLEIDPRFDRLEVYALNAWRPQGAYPSYQIYFRPMSLSRVGRLIMAEGGLENLSKLPVVDIAPPLDKDDIEISIDGQDVEVLEVNRIREASGPGRVMFGYVIQTDLPKKPADGEYSVIRVTITDPETKEMGEGWLYVRRTR